MDPSGLDPRCFKKRINPGSKHVFSLKEENPADPEQTASSEEAI